ncbi:MAG TPA: GTP 3',8-cyclase MoaA [Spirochaeta sp.]|nr:GTP 3',8-cyclase MoaA [Spirochaeta sp.]
MNDSYDRKIDYLRISITDRCNLRCLYCMPAEGIQRMKHSEILRYEEIEAVVRAAADLGVSKIRLTGGEPLVRPGVVDLVRILKSVPGIDNISLTTNAILLEQFAQPLADAGLDRVNISIDTLDAENFKTITRLGDIEKVFAGITAAADAGLTPIKINTVVIRGFNDHEIIDLSDWALQRGLNLRFIEFMPVNDSSFTFDEKFISSDDIREKIFEHYPDMEPCKISGSGPAVNWRRNGDAGSLGIIEAVSHSFCSSCNRIRLTADGKLKPCLFSNEEVDLIPALRDGDLDRHEQLEKLIAEAVVRKPASHRDFTRVNSESRCMNEIGG